MDTKNSGSSMVGDYMRGDITDVFSYKKISWDG